MAVPFRTQVEARLARHPDLVELWRGRSWYDLGDPWLQTAVWAIMDHRDAQAAVRAAGGGAAAVGEPVSGTA